MIKIIIKNNLGIITHGAEFESLELSQPWIDSCVASNAWGKAAYTEIIPAKEAVLDENNVEIEPAIAEEIIEHPAEYTIEIVDITAQVEQERINDESLAYLASTDWMVIRQMDSGVPMPEDVKQARQEARNKIVK